MAPTAAMRPPLTLMLEAAPVKAGLVGFGAVPLPVGPAGPAGPVGFPGPGWTGPVGAAAQVVG